MKTQINSILIPTDFSNLSESALKVGIAIAKRQNAEITLLHVVDRFNYIEPNEVFLHNMILLPDIVSKMSDIINEISSKIQSETGIRINGKVIEAEPSDGICSYAFQEKIDLIVMGTHGTSGLREFFVGSEAFRVVKNASCPVLTIPGGWAKTDFGKVLLPIRLKPGATDKYFFSRPIIEKNNSEIYLLGLSNNKKPGELKNLTVILDKLKLQLYSDDVKFYSAFSPCEDFPSKVIEVANSYGADLIVLTANLDYDFKARFIGPFAQRVINHSKIPVLSIKPTSKIQDKKQHFKIAYNWGNSINSLVPTIN